MATPTLRNLRQHVGPNTRIIGISKPYIREVLTGSSWLDEMIWYNPRSDKKEQRVRSVIRQLRSQRVDEAYLLTNSLRSAWIAWRAGIREQLH